MEMSNECEGKKEFVLQRYSKTHVLRFLVSLSDPLFYIPPPFHHYPGFAGF